MAVTGQHHVECKTPQHFVSTQFIPLHLPPRINGAETIKSISTLSTVKNAPHKLPATPKMPGANCFRRWEHCNLLLFQQYGYVKESVVRSRHPSSWLVLISPVGGNFSFDDILRFQSCAYGFVFTFLDLHPKWIIGTSRNTME